MAKMTQITSTVTMVSERCCECGIDFCMPEHLYQERLKTGHSLIIVGKNGKMNRLALREIGELKRYAYPTTAE